MEKNQFKIMTETPVGKLILKLCMPTILSMLVTNFYNLVDTAFVGMEGNSASGAVGIVFGFMAVLQAIGFLFGQGSGSIISRALGGKKIDKAGEVASTAFFTAFFLAVAAGIFSLIFIDDIVFFSREYGNHCSLCKKIHFLYNFDSTFFGYKFYAEQHPAL